MYSTSHNAADPRRMMSMAVRDITSRTLAGISNGFGRLICLASTRDYNTGQYHHEGLVSRFSGDVAAAALAECHREIFQELVQRSLADLVAELEEYVASTGACRADVVETWEKLQPYRVAIPLSSDRLSAELFFSNIRIGLEVLRFRQQHCSPDRQSS
jgi:hypothetical protein